MKYKKEILELRKIIPIGIKEAAFILNENEGNVEAAIPIWKNKQINQFAEKYKVEAKEAEALLLHTKFIFQEAEKYFWKYKTTDLEKIIQSSKDESKVLSNLHKFVEYKLGPDVTYGGWVNEEGFEQLPPLIRDVLIVWQWYMYFENENYSVEQSITSHFISVLKDKLGETDLANNLQLLKDKMDTLYKESSYYELDRKRQGQVHGKLISSSLCKRVDKLVEEKEDEIMKKCLQYILENKDEINEGFKNINYCPIISVRVP